MARDYFDESKKKKKKQETPQKKIVKSPSVSKNTQRTQQAQNQKSYGGMRNVPTQRSSTQRSAPQRTSQATQRQQPRRNLQADRANNQSRNPRIQDTATTVSRTRTPATSREMQEQRRQERENRLQAAQRQKMTGGVTREQQESSRRAIRNTPATLKKAGQDVLYGHAQTIADLTEMTASNRNGTRAKAMKMGIDLNDRKQMEELERERKLTVEKAREDRLKWASEQEKRQAEFDKRTKDAKGLEKAYYGALESGVGMASDQALGPLWAVSMMSRTYGNTRGQAQKEGATENEDRAYSLLQAAKEVATEYMFRGVGLARGLSGSKSLAPSEWLAKNITKNMKGPLADLTHAGIRLAGGTTEENIEELAGWGLDPLVKEFTYGRNVRKRQAQDILRQQSDQLRSNIESEDEARAIAAYLSTDDFIEQNKRTYMDSGVGEAEAEDLALKMRDYLTASLSGDTDTMEQLEADLTRQIAGKGLRREDWSLSELMDTWASTTLLTMATGLPGTATTTSTGAAIRDQLGSEGIRALANTAIDFEDGDMSVKAQAMRDRMDAGKEITSTQAYDLMVGAQEQYKKDSDRQQASLQTAQKTIQEQNLVTPFEIDRNGRPVMDEVTDNVYKSTTKEAKNVIQSFSESDEKSSLTDEKIDSGARAIAGFQTGVFTVDDANELNFRNTAVRDAFKATTGIDLNAYVVRGKNGEVDIPATNAATKNALFAMAADNLVASATAETANWMDVAKGQVVSQISQRMGSNGTMALQKVLDDVDERNRDTYMMTANATDMLYQAARNMGTSWESVSANATKMFPGISEATLKSMYDAGLADRDMATDTARGKQIKIGESIKDSEGPESAPMGELIIDPDVEVKGTVARTFSELATNLGINIRLVSSFTDEDGNVIKNQNGMYDPNTGTITLNVRAKFEKNLGYIFMHECTHHLRTYAPEQYQKLEDLVREKWFKYDPSQMQNAIAKKIEAYAKAGQKLTEDQALEEIIADAAHEFLTDPNFASEVSEENPSLAKAVLDSIRNAMRAIRKILSLELEDETHMNTLFSQLDILDEAERLWLGAYKQAVANRAAVGIRDLQNQIYEEGKTAASLSNSASAKYERGDKLTHKQFNSFYSAHKLNYGASQKADLEETIDSIKRDGFTSNTALSNVVPASINDFTDVENPNYTQGLYGAREGDTVLLVPKPYLDAKNDTVKNGFVPRDYEIVIVERDYQPYYELYEKAYDEAQARFSITPAQDAEYMDAVERGDMETAQRMVDAKAMESMPNTQLKGKWFHGTENEFTVFDFSQGGKNGHAEGFGIYLSNSQDVTSHYGNRQIESYVNMVRPASQLDTQTLTKAELRKLIAATVEQEAQAMADDYDGNVEEAKFDTWISNYTDTRFAGSIDKAIDEVIKGITTWNGNDMDIIQEIIVGMGIRDYDSASKFYDLLTETTGIDGFITKWGDEDEMNDPNTPTIAVAFRSSQIKSADPVTYDDDGNVIPLSARFDTINPDIRYSLSDDGIEITEGGSAVKYSLTSWGETDQDALLDRLVAAGYEKNVAEKWLEDVNSVAAIIHSDMSRLNYVADRFQPALKPNSEYYYTLDLSTLCQKRRLYQGTYNAIMDKIVNYGLKPADTVRLRKMMADMGHEVPCGICYEESRKKNEGKFAETWLNGQTDKEWNQKLKEYDKKVDKYKQALAEYNALEDKGKKKQPKEPAKPVRWMGYANMEHEDPYIPTIADVTTTTGRDRLRQEGHLEALEAYLDYQKGRGSANPKVSFTHTDYRGDILNMTPTEIQNVKHIGGLRIQSFSDFETVHVIDMMQAVMDMAAMKLTSQAYTKVPAFADIFGGTGIKINLSLIQKMDENGNPVYDSEGRLVFDPIEGIDPDEAFRIREKYSDNVGTILVGVSTQQILDAWADPRVDMVIPFHRSGWSLEEFEKLGLKGYEDFQAFQSEAFWDEKQKKYISLKEAKMEGIYSEDYWDDSKSGKENAQAYLDLCAKKHYRPVFYNFLQDNGDGTWSLKEDGSTDGYWKSLVDYKMYNNEGKDVSKQQEVQPVFDMEVAEKVMSDYEGNADTLPIAQDVVEAYVKDYKKRYPKAKIDYGKDVRLSISAELDDAYMSAVNSGNMEEAQRLVDEAAKRAGYTETLYHGTGEYFNVFRLGNEGIHLGNAEQAKQVADLRFEHRSKTSDYIWKNVRDNISALNDEARKSLLEYAYLQQDYFEDGESDVPFDGDISNDSDVIDYVDSIFNRYANAHNKGLYDERYYQAADDMRIKMRTWDRQTDKHVMKLYANLDNPFVINGDIGYWTTWDIADRLLDRADGKTEYRDELTEKTIDISGSELSLGKWTRKALERLASREIAGDEAWRVLDGVLEQAGDYHGIKYLNQYEGDKNSYSYIATNRSQVKSADTVTYAGDGSVIPLSQRFDPENNDIRYSMSTEDSDGNILTDGQMEYFKNSQARDEQGRLALVYHTTESGGFTIFDPQYSDDKRSLFFASNFDVSQTYGRHSNRPIDLGVNNGEGYRSWAEFEKEAPSLFAQTNMEWEDDMPASYNLNAFVYRKATGAYADELGIEDSFDNWLRMAENGEDVSAYQVKLLVPNKDGELEDVKADSLEELLQKVSNLKPRIVSNQRGYYSCYLNLENPLIVDANGSNWNAIPYSRPDNNLRQHLQELSENSDMVVKSLIIAQDDINDDGIPMTMRVRVQYKKKTQGEGLFENIHTWDTRLQTFEKTIKIDSDEIEDMDFSKAVELPWMKSYDALMELGIPSSYINELELNFVDNDGDVIRNIQEPAGMTLAGNTVEYDYINSKEGTFEIVDTAKYGTGQITYRTRELAEIADNEGHDGVIIRNCRDIGGAAHLKRGANPISDIFIAFSSDQVKDIRNTDPTNNPDIRYSYTEDDENELMNRLADACADNWSSEELLYYENLMQQSDAEVEKYFKQVGRWSDDKVSVFFDALSAAEEMPSDDDMVEEGRVRVARSKNDFFTKLNAQWKDSWLTDGAILDVDSVKGRIRQLVRANMMNSDTDRQYKEDVIKRTLIDVRLAYLMAKKGRHDVADEILWKSGMRMIENVDFIEDSVFKDYKGLRDYLRTAKISLGERYHRDVDINSFRKRNFNRINLVKGETNVDEIYHELCELYPEWFKEDDALTPPDQLLRMEQVLDAIQPYKIAYTSEEATQLAFYIASDLADIVYGYGKPVESIADKYKNRYDEKTKALKQRHQEAQRKANKEISELKKDLARAEKTIEREQERTQKAKDKLAAEKQKRKDEKAKTKDNKARAKATGHIQKNYDWLTKRLLNPTQDKNIPEGFRKDLARLLCMFDFQTERSKALEEKYGIPAQKTFKMWDLHAKLCGVANEDNGGVFSTNEYIEFLSESIAKRIDGKSLDSLESQDLVAVDELLKVIVHQFQNYNQVRIDEKKQEIGSIGEEVIDESERKVAKRGQAKEFAGARGIADNILNFAELTPIYFFQRLGTMYKMYREIRKGFDTYVRNEQMILNRITSICSEYYTQKKNRPGSELQKWRDSRSAQEIPLTHGTITMTAAQMMSLYCLNKRNQARGHMFKDGIVVTPIQESSRIEKARNDLKGREPHIDGIPLTFNDMQTIIGKLTPEQMKIADKLQDLMSNEMAQLGNEASMRMYGIRQFKEKDYFPIKVSNRVTKKNAEDIDITETIKNFGFTKPLQPNASNVIEIDDIFTVVANHCNEMNLYASYGESINDFWRVFNYKSFNEDGTSRGTVQQALAKAYGDKALKYIKNFIKDINGSNNTRKGGLEAALNSALSKAKKASVFANMRVALQQPTAIIRAFAVINPKYIKGIKPDKNAMKEMFEHCPIAQWKSWGFYDTLMGRDIEDIMMNNWSMGDVAMSGIYGTLDNITWTAIWQMCKAEVEDTHKDVEKGSDEYWDLVNERASYVFDSTQVVDSPFHRSDAMRSKDIMIKSLTSFQSEPTLTFNVVRAGIVNAMDKARDGNRSEASKIFGRTITVLLAQAAAVSAASALWDAVRRKGADDDEDLTYWELWLENFKNNMFDNINLLNNIYLAKEVWPYIDKAFFGGYGANNNLIFQGLDTLATGITQFKKKMEKGDAYDKSWYDVMTNVLGSVGYFTGIPVKTLMRDFKGITSWFGIDVFAADELTKSAEGVAKTGRLSDTSHWYDYNRNPLQITDGSLADNVLNHFGINLTQREKEQRMREEHLERMEKKGKEIGKKISGLSGEERDKKAWSALTSFAKDEHGDQSINGLIAAGDFESINEYRSMYMDAVGNADYFDERIYDLTKKAMKKTIIYNPTYEQAEAQNNIKNYLLEHGMTESELSEIAYKSATKKELQVAFRINDEDAIMEELIPLVMAGLTYEDFERIYNNRNRLDIKKYKESGGKYADRLKSTGTYIWSVNGTITSGFGHRSSPGGIGSTNHKGIDIAAGMGTPVAASDGGTVIYAYYDGGFGKCVRIQHDDGTITEYAHLSWWDAQKGDVVAQGQIIGKVGSTGNSTGPHLHFGVMKNGSYVDPMKYLENKKS